MGRPTPTPSPAPLYRTGQFAERAAISVRTLRYYDQSGLLSPSHRSDTGHRFYSDDDLARLQQILALKFLGFSLKEIRLLLEDNVKAEPETLQQALNKQKCMMEDKRTQLENVLRAIEHTQAKLKAGENDWENVVKIIEVIQMEKKQDWVESYFTSEQRETMQRLYDESYSEAAKRKLATWKSEWDDAWTEEDQQRVDTQAAQIATDLKRLVVAGYDPANPEAQEVARLQVELISRFTRGDPDIEAGVMKFVESGAETFKELYEALPDAAESELYGWSKEENVFLAEAIRIYQSR